MPAFCARKLGFGREGSSKVNSYVLRDLVKLVPLASLAGTVGLSGLRDVDHFDDDDGMGSWRDEVLDVAVRRYFEIQDVRMRKVGLRAAKRRKVDPRL